jgi:dihydrofolate synthase/folylpolyglutamate synthase
MPPLERIAFEKAGIAKHGVPLVTMNYAPAIAERIATVAKAAGAPIFSQGLFGGWAAKPGGADRHLVYGEGEDCYFHGPPPAMPGRHQINNAGLAIANDSTPIKAKSQ